jgi:sulfhydrogenase subunit beta (sulfur reductase)
METILKKENLGQWAAEIAKRAAIYAPAFADDIWIFDTHTPGEEITFEHGNTVRPAKGFVFPQREVLLRFKQEKGKAPEVEETLPKAEPVAVFGVRPCDGRALVRNDKVFSCGPCDPYYQTRRDNVAFIGLTCNTPPSPNCFCNAVGGSPCAEDGLDILMTELDGRYHVKVITPKGGELVDSTPTLFEKVTAADSAELETVQSAARAHPQRSLAAMEQVAEGIRRNFESPKWDELARACLGCGACTYLCPSCHCFDLNDEITGQSPLRGERVRTWDNCQFPEFTMHTSGHNPRESLGSRLRQRVAHKLLYFVENHNMQQCTGCGRCITHCPVGIDFLKVANIMEGAVA